jgi:hypothetical protein
VGTHPGHRGRSRRRGSAARSDEFFDGKLAPLLETNRGCPFTCTFCVQGVRWYTKVHNFGKDRLKAEIEYIGAMIKERVPAMGFLRIADSNYGMFESATSRVSSYIAEAQAKYGWPTLHRRDHRQRTAPSA